jgi:mono/diheme cytochrome c family protein
MKRCVATLGALSCFLIGLVPGIATAQTDETDLQIQGEYIGEKNFMQVIARGDGEFEVVVYEDAATNEAIVTRPRSTKPPRRLDADAGLVADLADSLEVQRVERRSSTLDAPPPAGAVVLFDGSEASLQNWKNGRLSEDGFLKQGTTTRQTFRDYSLHLEFRTPWMPAARGQGRGNSGVYHQGRYETQVLDSFGLQGGKNETGAIYDIKAPDINACLPPTQWQTYDVDFTAARYEGDKKVADARMTVRLNGITVQSDVPVPRATRAAPIPEGPEDGPIYLQDHGNEVRFRNIWLLPRDADKEAERPIVPGFERFFATSEDELGLGGETLISNLGCIACHAGDEGPLPVKQAPNLSAVAGRVRADALLAMISDPHAAKRGTTMPDPWTGWEPGRKEDAVASIASYLLLAGQETDLVDRPTNSATVKKGQELYHSIGCVACHASFDGTQFPMSTTVPLGDVAAKYTIDSLTAFLLNPHDVRQGGRMPALTGDVGEAHAIASYLTRLVTERENTGKFKRTIYRGNWQKLPDFASLEPVAEDETETLEINDQSNPNQIGMVYEAFLRIEKAGKYPIAVTCDDGARVTIAGQSVANDGIHPRSTRKRTFELPKGLHPIKVEWFNGSGERVLEVTVTDPLLGDTPLREMVVDPKAELPESLLPSKFQPDASLVERGKQLFQTVGCASCHAFEGAKKTTVAAPALVDLKTDQGCLAETVAGPAVDYRLSPSQRSAIERAIRLRKKNASTAESIADEDRVHVTLAGMNCYACHRRDRFGGPEATRDAAFETTTAEMGWEGRLPPPLDGVGDKLTDSYLSEAIERGANLRPYMRTRMPGFGKETLNGLHAAVVRLDRIDGTETIASPHADELETVVSDGRKLVGGNGLACIKCHAYNGDKGGGIGAIDLLAMPKRLRSNWFLRYLQAPTKYRPGTRMPNSFQDGVSAYKKLYDGDPHQQISAMWSYLGAGTSVKEPAGLKPGAIMLKATDRPRIYRNFFENATGRGIAVGYPAEVNLIWDAERMGLSTVWKNEFVDASRHWSGRGQGRIGPAGDQIQALERWTPLIEAASETSPWPDQTGRELGARFIGYRLDESGNPAFRYRLAGRIINDAIEPIDRNGFRRVLSITREDDSSGNALVWKLAEGSDINRVDDGFQVGDVTIKLSGAEARLVQIDDRTELRAVIPANDSVQVTEVIQW